MFTMAAGIIKENWNKDLPGHVQVEYSMGEKGSCLTSWLPVMTGYAGPGYGNFALPEVGSEVVVGFLHNNCDQPFVMGCLWGRVNTLPEESANKDNSKKLLRLKGGFLLSADETEEAFSLKGPSGENLITLADKDGALTVDIKTKCELKIGGEVVIQIESDKVTVKDKVEITDDIKLTGGKIQIKSSQNMELEAGQGMNIKGQNMAVKGTDIQLDGKQVKLKGTQFKAEGASLELKAQGSGKLESGGILQVKGAIVKIN